MSFNKVEICSVDTSTLTTLTEDEKQELLRRTKGGDKDAREKLITGNLRLVLRQEFSDYLDLTGRKSGCIKYIVLNIFYKSSIKLVYFSRELEFLQ